LTTAAASVSSVVEYYHIHQTEFVHLSDIEQTRPDIAGIPVAEQDGWDAGANTVFLQHEIGGQPLAVRGL